MRPRCLAIGLAGCAALNAGAVVSAPAGDSPVPFVTVDHGVRSGVREPLQALVRTPEEWRALWTRHAGRPAPPPPVDFASEMVVAIFLGTRPTSGHAVEITQVRSTGHGIEVTYRERTPPPGTLLRPVLTIPFHIIRMPRSDEPVSVRPTPA
jgi:hypothetical protein